ncbi:MAG: hypothetical protein NUV70_00990 [Caldiserica bacterium]|nr:hypothetical protein [Caldisericota bacterium]
MRFEAHLSAIPVHFKIYGPAPQEGDGSLFVQEMGIQVTPEFGSAFLLPHFQMDWLKEEDYSLTLGFEKEGKLELSRLGAKKEEALRQIWEGFQKACFKALFLKDEELRGISSLKISTPNFTEPGKIAVFPWVLIMFARGNGVKVIPMRFLKGVSFDEQSYSVHLETAQERFSLSQLGALREKFLRDTREAYEASNARLSELFGEYLPEIDSFTRQALSALLFKEGTLRKVDVKDAENWEEMLSLIPEEKKEYVRIFLTMAPPENTYFGLAPSPSFRSDLPYLSWLSAQFGDLLAFEVTSIEDFATYFFRIPGKTPEEKKEWIKSVHIFWPLLGFHREILFKEEAELSESEKYSTYLLLKLLPIFASMRENFIKRVIHTEPKEWEKQIREVTGK